MKYTCPMHREVVRDTPGKCPRCGMALVLKDNVKLNVHQSGDKGLGTLTWRSYMPIILIVVMIAVASAVAAGEYFSFHSFILNFILYFMTGLFLVFSGFKLLDLRGFAEGYATYDLLAQKWKGYGYVYPFIELAFGLLMLAGIHSAWLLWAEIGVMVFSGAGVAVKLSKGEEFQCACLGTFLKVPLTKVTLIEDFGMALLALLALLLG